MVSPSGISSGFLNVRGVVLFRLVAGIGGNNERLGAAHLIPEHGIHEASIFQVGSQKMFACWSVVDFANQKTLPKIETPDGQFRQLLGELSCEEAALGFRLRKKNTQSRIAAPQKCGDLSVYQDYRRPSRSGHGMMSERLIGFAFHLWPRNQSAVG